MNKKQKNRKVSIYIISFLVKFFCVFFALSLLIEFLDLSWFTNAITSTSANLLGLQYAKNVVFVGAQEYIISNSCTGLVSVALLAGLIFALKNNSFKKKLVVFILGSAFLLLFNIPRIMLVLYSAKIGFDADLVHTLTWFMMSIIVLVIWYVVLQKQK